MTSVELREQRAALFAKASDIINRADGEKRSVTNEEQQQWDRIMGEVDSLKEKIDHMERAEYTAQVKADLEKSTRKTAPTRPMDTNRIANYSEAIRAWCLKPKNKHSQEGLQAASECGINLFDRNLSLRLDHKRALSVGTAAAGGHMATNLATTLERQILSYGPVLNLVTIEDTEDGNTLPYPSTDDTANEAVIIGEGANQPTNLDPTFANINLGAYQYSTGAVIFSLILAQDSFKSIDDLLTSQLGERLGRKWAKDVTRGVGTTEPFGLTTRATASGVVVGGTVASPTFTFEQLMDLEASVDPGHREVPGAGYMMHDSIAFRFRKLKTTDGAFLWQPSVQQGQPDRLHGRPVYVNNSMPTLATNAKIILYGNYKKYVFRRVRELNLQRLDELYFISGQAAIGGLARADGNLMNVNAVKSIAAPAA